jgi:uncharacterized protein YlxP (DUF503 family)
MSHLFVGVAQVEVNLRHSGGMKDKRRFLNSIEQRLKNLGFSVTHSGHVDNPKRALIGFAIVGNQYKAVESLVDEGVRLFTGMMAVVDSQTDVFDYSESKEDNLFDFLARAEEDDG